MKRAWQTLLSGLGTLLRVPLALLILFEEWGWEPLQRMAARLMQWPGLRALERWVGGLPPWGALAVFAIPALALLPVKMAALWLLANGQRTLGLMLIVAAKLVGTAVMARLFALTQPALMRMPWFARWYGRWTAWKAALLASVRASAAWQGTQRAVAQAQSWMASWLRRWRGD